MSELETTATRALEPVSTALEADGYALSVEEEDGGGLAVHVRATNDACEECLAPKTVIQPMVEELLRAGGVSASPVRMTYPTD